LLARLQDVNQSCFLVFEIFFGIDAPVDGEPAFVRYDVEIRSAPALPTHHQDGVPRARRPAINAILRFGFAANLMDCRALLHFSLQREEALDNAMHALESVFSAMLQTHVRRFAEYVDPHRDRAAVCVPNHAAGWLGHKHADAIASQQPAGSEPGRAASPSRLFVRH
jgi:hypothetical protein